MYNFRKSFSPQKSSKKVLIFSLKRYVQKPLRQIMSILILLLFASNPLIVNAQSSQIDAQDEVTLSTILRSIYCGAFWYIDESCIPIDNSSIIFEDKAISLVSEDNSANSQSFILEALGIKGDKGDPGKDGERGPIGPQGSVGSQDITGLQGEIGLTGSQGETGSQGPTGLPGNDGPQGEAGVQGETGPQGPQGDAGTSTLGDSIDSSEIENNAIVAADISDTLTFSDGDLLDLSAINISSITEGLILPQTTDCSTGITEGQICWDSDNNELSIGTGSTLASFLNSASTLFTLVGSSGSSQDIFAGDTVTISAGSGITTTSGATDSVTIASTLGTSVDVASEITGVLPIANGGSNKALTLAAGGVLWSDVDSFELSSAGSSNQLLLSGGAATPSWSNIASLLSAGNGLEISGTTTASYDLGDLTSDWNQTGAFDIILDNASSELSILESAGGTFYATLDAGDLSSDITYTLSGASGTILTNTNYSGTLNATYLQVANNLSDLASASTARTNLGLDTIATQSAGSVAISGGTINGTTIGGSTPAAGIFSTLAANTSVSLPHLLGTGSTPTISEGSGAGTGASASITGSDIAGQVTLNTGTFPSASSTAVTVTFASPYSTAPYVVLFPSNSTAALLSGVSMIYVTSSPTTFILTSGTTGLTAASTYKWHYQVVQ